MLTVSFQESDAIVICDAGGGTVDLVAYEIDSVNPLKLRALSAPSGKPKPRFLLPACPADTFLKVAFADL